MPAGCTVWPTTMRRFAPITESASSRASQSGSPRGRRRVGARPQGPVLGDERGGGDVAPPKQPSVGFRRSCGRGRSVPCDLRLPSRATTALPRRRSLGLQALDLAEHGAIVVAPVDLVAGLHDDEGTARPCVVRAERRPRGAGRACASIGPPCRSPMATMRAGRPALEPGRKSDRRVVVAGGRADGGGLDASSSDARAGRTRQAPQAPVPFESNRRRLPSTSILPRRVAAQGRSGCPPARMAHLDARITRRACPPHRLGEGRREPQDDDHQGGDARANRQRTRAREPSDQRHVHRRAGQRREQFDPTPATEEGSRPRARRGWRAAATADALETSPPTTLTA